GVAIFNVVRILVHVVGHSGIADRRGRGQARTGQTHRPDTPTVVGVQADPHFVEQDGIGCAVQDRDLRSAGSEVDTERTAGTARGTATESAAVLGAAIQRPV